LHIRPSFLLVIVATGNHFFFDAAAGAVVAAMSAALAQVVRPARPQADVVPIRRGDERAPRVSTSKRAA